jgi:hypothetical protein
LVGEFDGAVDDYRAEEEMEIGIGVSGSIDIILADCLG